MGNEFIKNIKYLGKCVLDLIYSNGGECIACGEYIGEKDLLCNKCSTNLKMFNKSFEIINKNQSIKCYSAFYYSGLSKELIGKLKYKSDFRAGEVLAKYMTEIIKNYSIDFDLVTYVPSSRAAMKKRGYNQSEYLAKSIGDKTNTKVIQLLKKNKETKDQIGLGGEERWINLQDCFEIINEEKLKCKKILLVDDVITTGATAFHCSKLMLEKGADNAYILTGAKSSI